MISFEFNIFKPKYEISVTLNDSAQGKAIVFEIWRKTFFVSRLIAMFSTADGALDFIERLENRGPK